MLTAVNFLYLLVLLHALEQPFPAESPPRHHALSTDSPITAELTSDGAVHPALANLHALFATISEAIDSRIASNDSMACNLRGVHWVKDQQNDFKVRQLGQLDRTCQSRMVATDAASRNELVKNFFDIARITLRDGAVALGDATARFVENEERLDWSVTHAVTGWDVMKGGQTCNIETATAYRIDGKRYIRAVGTNHPVEAFQPDWERQYVEELVRLDGPALRTVQPEFPDGELQNASTVLIRRGGKAGFSSVAMGDAENPALEEALRLNELAVDQARDAITPSNTAILAFPMVMSLIPVAFVAEMNTCAMLLYITFTDVFSVMPFLIKGIELTTTGVVRRGELVAYHLGTPQLGVLEIWAAECHGETSFRDLGILYMVIAISAMFLGIGIELYAWRWMKRKGRLGRSPFGEVLRFRVNEYTVLERTIDPMDGEYDEDGERVVRKGSTRWKIRRKRRRRKSNQDGVDDVDDYD